MEQPAFTPVLSEKEKENEKKNTYQTVYQQNFTSCLEKQSKCKEFGKVLNHILSRGKVQTTFQDYSNLWLEEKVVIENHWNCSIMNSPCKNENSRKMGERNPEEVHSESHEGKKSIANPSSD